MRPTSEALSEFVRQSPHVRACTDLCSESNPIAVDFVDLESLDYYRNRLQLRRLSFTGEFVGWDASDLLGRIRRRYLLDTSAELGRDVLHRLKRYLNFCCSAHGLTGGVIGIGRESQANLALVGLVC